ncbi:MAG: hydroxymyristoyl-ACP dehydratase [Bacteroidia bacterium]|nr:hydroxymyristoyl-ACP dehydratase [Bacteroidia bacterium]NNF31397.1 hydroxymyristoyl-ACP dehydratase [Flavobacteriaceae bacterium]MBT8275936.1 hydroxymyristoyl-ACP dehydratase [Bacteroidia bacterium]NNJ81232.1 hydroxymyristoyl-ACP dehydratase [Flavobacteriaceae bacterium]NNK53011.1 hydroxymyristoyl-ACP dehydratase [Flavobacteriaceae bacterium]
MEAKSVISKLPYSKPFLFVDAIEKLDDNGIAGYYTFHKDEYFYEGHFKDNPITPGVILTECMAQIGLVCFGIHLLKDELDKGINIAMSSTEIDFLKPVFPEEKVKVISQKIYFRFNKLKCKVKMLNSQGEVVCNGTISGMLILKGS